MAGDLLIHPTQTDELMIDYAALAAHIREVNDRCLEKARHHLRLSHQHKTTALQHLETIETLMRG